MLFRRFPGQLFFTVIKLLFKGFNKQVIHKYNSKDDVPDELRSIYESLLQDKDKNGVPDVFDENGTLKKAIEDANVLIANSSDLDSLPSDVREKYEALLREQNSGAINYSLDNAQNENHDLNQIKHNTLQNFTDEDIDVVKRNQNNSFPNLLVLTLMVIGLVLLGVMLIN